MGTRRIAGQQHGVRTRRRRRRKGEVEKEGMRGQSESRYEQRKEKKRGWRMVRGRSGKKREVKSVRKGWEVEERKAWRMSRAEVKEKQKIEHRWE